MKAYLQHGKGTDGPFSTEEVEMIHDGFVLWFKGRWRRVYFQAGGKHILYQGKRIAVQFDEEEQP